MCEHINITAFGISSFVIGSLNLLLKLHIISVDHKCVFVCLHMYNQEIKL